MTSDKDIWEGQYRSKGDVWRGTSDLPFEVKGPKVLELGCGNGKTASALMSTGASPICLDISRSALVRCGSIPSLKEVPLVEGDVIDLPFRDGIFDSVVCFHVLEHLLEKDRERAAREIARVLSDEGMAYIQAFTVRDMRFGKGTEVEKRTFVRGDGVRYHYFEDEEIETLFPTMCLSSKGERELEKRYHGKVMRRSVIQISLIK